MVADLEEYGVRPQTNAFDRGATVEECSVAALDVFTDQAMGGNDLDTTVVLAEILRGPGGFPMPVVIDHQDVAAQLHLAGKDLIGRHHKILIETLDVREDLPPELPCAPGSVATQVGKVRLRSGGNDNHVRREFSKQCRCC